MRFVAVLGCCLALTATDSAARTFASDRCHVSFEVPNHWRVVVRQEIDDSLCSISVNPPNDKKLAEENDGVDLYGFTVDVLLGSFESFQHKRGFVEEDGQWHVLGRQGLQSPAFRIRGSGWRGLRGTSSTGCYGNGGYAGLCEVEAALIGNAKWSVEMYAAPQSAAEFNRALKSLRFK